jgi:hypothetical protein
MESKLGDYYRTSAYERLNKRNVIYLHKLPEYFEVDNWWKYLTKKLDLSSVWECIKRFTRIGNPIGNNEFLGRFSSNKRNSNLYDIHSTYTKLLDLSPREK